MIACAPPPKVGTMEFSRRFRELVAGEQQREVANKLGYTASRVSQVLRGEKPSREFVERVVELYGVERDEWLGYAGFGPNARTTEADTIADAVEERLRKLLGGYNVTPAPAPRVNEVSPDTYDSTYAREMESALAELAAEGILDTGEDSGHFGGTRTRTAEDAKLEVEEFKAAMRRLYGKRK